MRFLSAFLVYGLASYLAPAGAAAKPYESFYSSRAGSYPRWPRVSRPQAKHDHPAKTDDGAGEPYQRLNRAIAYGLPEQVRGQIRSMIKSGEWQDLSDSQKQRLL